MSPARRCAPEVLGRLNWLTPLLPLLLLLLLLCPRASRGDCKPPPDMPNAQASLNGLTSFPEGSLVTYTCDQGFTKLPGKADTVFCLKGDVWSEIEEFCNRSCSVPTRLRFASLQSIYNNQNYFPPGTVVEYDCRGGYSRDHSLSNTLTCLQNYTWSKPEKFCKKKSCPNPGEILNGHVNIKTDILFGGLLTFSCNTGYKLVGVTSTYCLVRGDNVDWGDPFPECKGSPPISKVTPAPQKPTTVDVSGTKAPSTPQKPTTVDVPETPPAAQTPITANSSVTQATPKTQRLTTAKASFTRSLPGTQKFTAAHAPVTKSLHTTQRLPSAPISATRSTAVPRLTTPSHASTPKGKGTPFAGASAIAFGFVAGALIIGIVILGIIFWDRGKSGTYICNTDSFANDTSSHWLFDLAKEERRRKCTEVHRLLVVSYKFLEPWTQYMQ
ncbi:complement decay-accelerating factor isoform X5 [Phyllostomus hastatus]|uniref:complement decay-accelerating factor isoform X5 n=1 Tax=Phyllostomus hastatus TaxID=9423 RepID=UPI001E681EA5|nr:complement decay-accelerating factor isoform X5 [Phyllostomus hastatus]